MKANILILWVFLLSSMLFSSCDNKVDINADYQEITIVYGLLDQSQPRQYIKITKTFQTEDNVLVAAKDPKNSTYSPNDLEVWLDEYLGNTYKRTIYLDSVMITNKDSGDFYFPNQIVYATPEGTKLSSAYKYHLGVKVKTTGRYIEGETNLVRDFIITRPFVQQQYASFTGNYNQRVAWESAKGGKLYQFVIRFFYTDIPASGPRSSHYVDLVFATKRSETDEGSEKMSLEFPGNVFYQNLAAKIPLPDQGMYRYADSLYYIFNVADEDFTTYMDINKPSNTIVQVRPVFSNISNGVGLFAARFRKHRYFAGLTPQSLDSLIQGHYTYQLGFKER